MMPNALCPYGQIYSQHDFNDRGVQFHLTKNLDIFAEINAPLGAHDQQQLSAFLIATRSLRDAMLLAHENLQPVQGGNDA